MINGIPSDPVFYGEWPWRGPQVIYKVSYRSIRELRVPAYWLFQKKRRVKNCRSLSCCTVGIYSGEKMRTGFSNVIPILTSQGYAVLAPDHFLFGERKIEGGFDEGSNRGDLIITGTGWSSRSRISDAESTTCSHVQILILTGLLFWEEVWEAGRWVHPCSCGTQD